MLQLKRSPVMALALSFLIGTGIAMAESGANFLSRETQPVVFKEKRIARLQAPPLENTMISDENREHVAYLSIGANAGYERNPDQSFGGSNGIFAVTNNQVGRRYQLMRGLRGFLTIPGTPQVYLAQRHHQWTLVTGKKEHGWYDEIQGFVISPDGRHFAFAGWLKDRWWLVIDQDKRGGYEAITGLQFAKNNQEVVFAARNQRQWRVYRQGQPGAAYDRLLAFQYHPLADRLVYSASRGGNYYLVSDGEETRLDEPVREIILSPDGSRVACFTEKTVVVDGKLICRTIAGVSYGSLFFSPDNQHYAFGAILPNQRPALIVDGYSRIIASPASPQFSADGTSVMCQWWDRQSFLINRKQGDRGAQPSELSRRGQQDASASASGGSVVPPKAPLVNAWLPVGDWASQQPFNLLPDKPSLISRGKYYVCEAQGSNSRVFLKTNNPSWQPEDTYASVQNICADPQGQHLAYVGQIRTSKAVFVDGRRYSRQEYADIQHLAFSPDGRHLLYLGQTAAGPWRFVVDEQGSPREYQELLLPRQAIAFPGQNRAVTLMLDQGKIIRVEARY